MQRESAGKKLRRSDAAREGPLPSASVTSNHAQDNAHPPLTLAHGSPPNRESAEMLANGLSSLDIVPPD